MRPFCLIQRIYIGLGLHPRYADPRAFNKFLNIFLAFVMFASQCSSLISDIIFMKQSIGYDLGNCLCVLFQVAATSNAVFILVIAYIQRKTVIHIFEEYEKIGIARKCIHHERIAISIFLDEFCFSLRR